MMKSLTWILSLSALLGVQSFTSSSSIGATTRTSSTRAFGYVPAGFTAESYKKFKEDEKKKSSKKNLGGVGPRGFKSRSFQSFQEALEKGEAAHMMPVFNAKEKVKKGIIKQEDIPYMQRGGSWDNSDVKGARKVRWLKSDSEYASGGFRKEQSVSIFGSGVGLDWSGTRSRKGPSETIPAGAPKFARNYKAPNVYKMKGAKASVKDEQPKKKFFGLF